MLVYKRTKEKAGKENGLEIMSLKKVVVTSAWMGLLVCTFVPVNAETLFQTGVSQDKVMCEVVNNEIVDTLQAYRQTQELQGVVSETLDELNADKVVLAEIQEQEDAEKTEEEERLERLSKELKATKSGKGTTYKIPSDWKSEFKSYMAYTAVTAKSSDQYKLLNDEKAYTDENGLRMYDGRYCIAMGSGFASKIGTKIDLVLKNGTIIQCVLGDQKSDRHTTSNNMVCLSNGSIAEFIIDKSVFYEKKDGSGTVNWVTTEAGSFDGKIAKVVIVNDKKETKTVKEDVTRKVDTNKNKDKDKKKKTTTEEKSTTEETTTENNTTEEVTTEQPATTEEQIPQEIQTEEIKIAGNMLVY